MLYLTKRITFAEITCPVPETPRSGRIVEQRYSNKKQNHGRTYKVGALVRFACQPGHQLVGEAATICTENGTWSHDPPVCECPYITKFYDILTLQVRLIIH